MFKQDPLSHSKLICKLTGDTIYKSEEHIRKHINGKQFLNKLEVKEVEKLFLDGIIEEQGERKLQKSGFSVRLVSLYGKSSMFEHAQKVFDEMPERNCKRTVLSLNALLGACVNSKRVDLVDGIIKELVVSHLVTIFNGDSSSNGSYSPYLVAFVALGVMGYCYMWSKGWSLSDVMFVTKHNMANVAIVSKQLEHVHEALGATKRHLTKKLENLDWKVEKQKETTKLIAND